MTNRYEQARLRRRLAASTALAAVLVAAGAIGPGATGQLEIGSLAFAESCCFTAGTLVLMADGRSRRIDAVRPGDLVLGRSGRANTVLGVERVPLAGRVLCGINGEAPFFTPEHPFLTVAGWRSVDPAASRAEGVELALAPLREGDLLVVAEPAAARADGALLCRLCTALVPLLWLRLAAADEQTVFNLMLDGDHTYVANRFVVHNKGGDGGDGGGEGGEGGDSGGGEGGEGGDSGGGEGGEGGDSGGEGGESGEGGEGGESGEGGEGGDSGEGGEGGESGEGGEGGEAGEGGEGGESGEGGFEGSAEPAGPDLTPAQEREMISRGWR